VTFKQILLVGSLLWSPCTFFAQQPLRFNDFFQQVLSDLDKVLVERADRPFFRPSLIEEIQFRSETDELNFKRQEYLVRIRPASSKIIKAQSKYLEIFKAQKSFERQELKEDFVEAAYQDWLDIHFSAKELDYKKKLLVLLNDEEMVITKLSQIPGSSVKEGIDIQKKIANLKIGIYKEERFLALSLAPDLAPETSGLITVSTIMEKIKTDDFLQAPLKSQQENAFEMQILDAESALERVEQKRYLDYIQFKYNGPHTDLFQEKVAVGIGFQLPFSDGSKLKLEELKMEKELTQDEFFVKTRLHQNEVKKQKQEIELLLDEWVYTQQLYLEIKTRSEDLIQKASQKEGTSPLLFLKNKTDLIEYDLDLLKTEESIYKAYIDLLILTGKLFEEPFVNYLSRA
jgi:hypothetical protein